jgi:hypothetical protein
MIFGAKNGHNETTSESARKYFFCFPQIYPRERYICRLEGPICGKPYRHFPSSPPAETLAYEYFSSVSFDFVCHFQIAATNLLLHLAPPYDGPIVSQFGA